MKLNRANTDNSVSVIIPKDIIKRLKWSIGDYVEINVIDDKVVINNLDAKERKDA